MKMSNDFSALNDESWASGGADSMAEEEEEMLEDNSSYPDPDEYVPINIELNTIYNEDCLETMGRMDDDSVDLVITSPPYNMNLRIRNGEYCSRQIVDEFSTKYQDFPDNLPIEKYNLFHTKVLSELLRISNLVFYNIQVVTGSKRSVFKMIGDFSEHLKDIIIWDKGVSQPAMQELVLNRQSELLLVFEKDNAISRQFKNAMFKRGELNDIWHIPRSKNEDSSHGATFPTELVAKILTNFSDEADVVYDPFMGTGTTALVCKKMNRSYIGSEINKSYTDISDDRLGNTGQMWIF
tara:strand:- start:3694 stop:4578 length:885 start_codon:yes stop_codon:yes gene_type:complete